MFSFPQTWSRSSPRGHSDLTPCVRPRALWLPGFGGSGVCSGAQAPGCAPMCAGADSRAGEDSWRPFGCLVWASRGRLRGVTEERRARTMASWVFCNRCFQPPSRTARFSLTSCGHVYCDGCLSRGGRSAGGLGVGSGPCGDREEGDL